MIQANQQDLALVLNGRSPLIILETYDERRAIALIAKLYRPRYSEGWVWTETQGLSPLGFGLQLKEGEEHAEPEKVLKFIASISSNQLFVLCDLHPHLDSSKVIRFLKDIALQANERGQKLILLSHQIDVPAELKRMCARASLSLPSDDEILAIVRDEARAWQAENRGLKIKTDPNTLNRLVANLAGLPHEDVRRLAHAAIVDDGAITEEDLPALTEAKFALMDMQGVMHFEYSAEHLKDIAGFDTLKDWLAQRRSAMLDQQGDLAENLNRPKGVMLFGVQGGGKSMAAKAIAGVWGIPLLRLDMAALYNKYVGETERNLREALKLADLMSPCILWIDEIEKGLAEESDNATAKRVLGTLLTWMAERKTRVFMVATSNDVSVLPPELMRKGRFDEIFFVDLPEPSMRETIFSIHLAKRKFATEQFNLELLAESTPGFTGAEIEQLIVSAMYVCAADDRTIAEEDIVNAIRQTQPLSVLRSEQIAALRHWAKDRAVSA